MRNTNSWNILSGISDFNVNIILDYIFYCNGNSSMTSDFLTSTTSGGSAIEIEYSATHSKQINSTNKIPSKIKSLNKSN